MNSNGFWQRGLFMLPPSISLTRLQILIFHAFGQIYYFITNQSEVVGNWFQMDLHKEAFSCYLPQSYWQDGQYFYFMHLNKCYNKFWLVCVNLFNLISFFFHQLTPTMQWLLQWLGAQKRSMFWSEKGKGWKSYKRWFF